LLSAYKTPSWGPGEYRFEVLGWVNKQSRVSKPNLRSTFHVRLTSSASRHLAQAPGTHPQFYDLEIGEWSVLQPTDGVVGSQVSSIRASRKSRWHPSTR
jgi:hypothetical protein